jgi:hypothetical protein
MSMLFSVRRRTLHYGLILLITDSDRKPRPCAGEAERPGDRPSNVGACALRQRCHLPRSRLRSVRRYHIGFDGTLYSSWPAGRRVGDVSTTIGNRTTRFPSEGERSFDRYTFTNRLAIAWVPDAFNSWNAGLYYSRRTEDRLADIFYNNTTTSRTTGQVINRISYFNSNLVRKQGEFVTANLDYLHTFTNKATLSAGALYEYDYISGFTANRNLNQSNFRDTLQYTITTTDRPIQNFRANLDASLPLGGQAGNRLSVPPPAG